MKQVSCMFIFLSSSFLLVSIFHLRDLCAKKRIKIKSKNVKVITIPYYEGLTIPELLGWARTIDNEKILQYLPEVPKECLKLPRQYLANVIYTVLGEQFRSWVSEKIVERNLKVQRERDMIISMDPEIAEIFKASSSISCKYCCMLDTIMTF